MANFDYSEYSEFWILPADCKHKNAEDFRKASRNSKVETNVVNFMLLNNLNFWFYVCFQRKINLCCFLKELNFSSIFNLQVKLLRFATISEILPFRDRNRRYTSFLYPKLLFHEEIEEKGLSWEKKNFLFFCFNSGKVLQLLKVPVRNQDHFILAAYMKTVRIKIQIFPV